MAVDVATLRALLVADTGQFSRSLSSASAQASRFEKSAGKSLSGVERSTMLLNKATKGMAVGVGVGMALSAKAAINWESAFTGVRKTIDGTEADFKALETGIRDMATKIPVGATALAEIAESAGQLGIKKANILGFTRVVADMGVATNLAGEEGAATMARFANITGMAQGNFDRLGSTIVALGNDGASTEAEIAAMGLRIAAAGKQVGLSEPQTLAYANALSSLGVEAEAGGTAISRVFKAISTDVRKGGDDLNLMAKVSGMSAAAFKKNFQTDAAGATQDFLRGLGKMQKSGGDVLGVLEELKFDDVRVSDSVLRLAGNSTVLADSLKTAKSAWQENTALQNEAARRYATTASQLQILKNHITEAGITIGSAFLPSINTAARLGVSLLHSADAAKVLAVAAGALVGRFAALGAVWAVGKIAAFISALGQVRAAIQLIGTAAMSGQLRQLPALFAAGGMSASALAGPIGLIVGGGIAAAGALGAFNSKARETAVTAQDAADAVNNYKNAMLGIADAKLGVEEAKLQVAQAQENVRQLERQKVGGLQLAQAKQALTRATLGQLQAQQRLNDADDGANRTTQETVNTLAERAAQLSVDIHWMKVKGRATAEVAAKERELASTMAKIPAAAAQASRGAKNLAKTYGEFPSVVKTVMQTDDAEALNKLDTLAGRLSKIAGKKTTAKIIGQAGNAEAAIDLIRRKLAELDGKTATVRIRNVSGGGPKARAGGGRVGADEPQTLVGEQGPEVVSLPTGSYVHTASASRRMMAAAKKKGPTKQERRDRFNERIQSRSRVLDLRADRRGVNLSDTGQADIGIDVAQRHLNEAKRMKGKGRAEAIAQAQLELANATKRLTDATKDAAAAERDRVLGVLDAGVALAKLTPAVEDDIAALTRVRDHWQGVLTGLQTDAIDDSLQGSEIAEAANNLYSSNEALGQITANNTAAMADLTAAINETNRITKATSNVTRSEVEVALLDIFNRGIGGRLSGGARLANAGASY